jgi:hypothetical protein
MTHETFFAYTIVADGCWPWVGPVNNMGYGYTGGEYAHRHAYELACGPIPAGFVLDHLCRNPLCVNPAHLEVVTQAENIRRGSNYRGDRTHCPRGHEYTPANTRVKQGKYGTCRECRLCHNIRRREKRQRLNPTLTT